ncbi:MAG TPA: hypothetical protein VI306_26085 [Pyrinomonadaceae bacterium]
MKEKSALPGARESNAGDDFHILWAARRAVQLLNPQNGLKKVLVEKLSTEDESLADGEEDLFLGVDLSEYFGGDTFASAERVDVSQLKYSTRHGSRAWTASRLGQINRGASVIRRLAGIYQGFTRRNSRDDVVEKLRIKLVSNQPADADLKEALVAAQEILSKESLRLGTLIKRLEPGHQTIMKAIGDDSALKKAEVPDFIRVLDLTSCGESPRQWQRLGLIKELSAHVKDDPFLAALSLSETIRREAEPEASRSTGLSEFDIMVALGVEDRERLFPAPSHFQPISRLVETSDIPGLAQTIINDGGAGKIIAHGVLGTGKTTTVQELHPHLPPGSIVITYDCFGGGTYKIPGSQRHPQRRAFTQITNQLAVQCGTPFLLRSAHEIDDLQLDFRRSLESAARIVEVEKEGLLVIVIDAADNAVIAAQPDRDCFVPVLWQIPLPENCRLVMTCRSHRRSLLLAPPDTVEYELKGFDEEASSSHLRTTYPNSSDTDCAEFHRRTGGNPRLQAYLLGRATDDPTLPVPLAQLFAGKRETLEEIFRDLLDSATAHLTHPTSANDLLADLMCLTPPIEPNILSEVHRLRKQDALSFCRSLEPGVRFENGAVWFRDEDFETLLRDQLTPETIKAAHERLGLWFLQAPNATAYAARFVGEHLAQAGKHRELIRLAIDGPEPNAVKDEIIRLQVLRKRLGLAMQSACATGDGSNGVRLVMLAAEAARSDGAVSALVRANPDLAVLCGNTNSARRLYLRDREYGWPGAAQLRLAAIFSRSESERERAKDHFEMGQAWIRRKFSLPENDTRGWEIQVDDIAHGAEAIFWIVGAEKAIQWLSTWKPKEVVLIAATHLVRSLSDRVPLNELELLIDSLKLPALANAVLLSSLWRQGHRPSFEFANRTAQRIERFLRMGRKLPNLSGRYSETSAWAVPFCEALAAAGVPADRTISILRKLGPTTVHSAPYYTIDRLDHELPLRGACLMAALEGVELTVEKLIPESLRERKDKSRYDSRNESDRRRFEMTIGVLLSAFQTRVQTIVGNPSLDEMEQRVATGLREHSFTTTYPVRMQFLFGPWALRACETLLRCTGNATDLLESIADAAEETIHRSAPEFWTEMAEQLIQQERYQIFAYHLVERAANYLMEHPFPARDRWQQLLNCAAAVSRFDENLSRDYYKRALAAAEGIDDDLIPLLTLYCRMSKFLPSQSSREERQHVSARVARLVETHKNYVSEESSLLWRETLEAVTRLSPPDGLALCARWDDENFCEVDSGVVPAVQESVRSGFLHPLEGLALLRLKGEEHDISADVIPLLEQLSRSGVSARPQLSQASATISEWVRRDVPLSSRKRSAQRILDWFEKNGLSGLPGLAELREIPAFLNDLRPTEQVVDSSIHQSEESEGGPIHDLIETAKDGNLETFAERLRALRQLSYGGKQVTDFVTIFGRALKPAQRLDCLERVVAAASDPLLAKDLIESLRGLLSEWGNNLGVREWLPNGVQRLIENSLPGLILYESETADHLRATLSLPGLSDQTRSQLLLPAIAKHLNQLSPRGLYSLAEALVEVLPAEAARDTLGWALNKTERHYGHHNRPLPALASPTEVESPPATLAHFFWSMFGHIDKRVRWRALHSARFIIKHADERVLGELMNLSKAETAGAFRSANPKLEFYWMSARSWLMLLLQRLADEQPSLLPEHLGTIAAHALDKNFPHAQIREVARRTVLRVIESFPDALPHSAVQQIRQANQPASCIYPRRSDYHIARPNSGTSDREEADTEQRFRFNVIDTIPYWFDPLSRIFAYPFPTVTHRATKWICEIWGRSNQDVYSDARKWRNEHQWQLMGNSHGSVPTLENLHTYLEYHALHCVAGELIDELLPIAVASYEDPEYPWESWITDEISSSGEYWLSDLRSPTPFLAESWGSWPSIEDWLTLRPQEDYDAAIGLGEPKHSGQIVIAGNIDQWSTDRHGDIHISSALVTPGRARSLLFALQTTANPHDFDVEMEIDEPGFELRNLYNAQRVDDGLDAFDSLSRNAGASRSIPTTAFINAMKLRSMGGRPKYLLPSGEIGAWLEIWSDQSARNRERISESFSEGRRLWVRIETLLEYLNAIALDLILDVKIARRRDYNSRKEEEKYDLGRSTLYLIRRDGRLETLSGSRDLRDADRARTWFGRQR